MNPRKTMHLFRKAASLVVKIGTFGLLGLFVEQSPVRFEFGAEPSSLYLEDLYSALSLKERGVCRRVSQQGPGNLPDGLVQKVHRLGRPFWRGCRLVREFL
jgi:hypothetical protein